MSARLDSPLPACAWRVLFWPGDPPITVASATASSQPQMAVLRCRALQRQPATQSIGWCSSSLLWFGGEWAERPVEEVADARLVLGGALADGRDVVHLRQLPQPRPNPGGGGVDPVELALTRAEAGRDEQERGRRNTGDQLFERRARA